MDLEEILAARQDSGPIAYERFAAWSRSEDVEALGALYDAVTEPAFYSRITPPLTNERGNAFVRAYLARCLREDPQGEWADSRYRAGWDLLGWVKSAWKRGDTEVLLEWKAWLEQLYREGSPEIRTCLITATLERLFEEPRIASFFSDWESDPLLADGYCQALEWSTRDGKSPL